MSGAQSSYVRPSSSSSSQKSSTQATARISTPNAAQNSQDNAKAKKSVQNLGNVKSLNAATRLIGGAVDALVAQEGEKSSFLFSLNIPIYGKNVLFSLKIEGNAAREAGNKVKIGGELQLGLMGQIELDAVFMKVEGYLRGAGFGFIESVGSNGAEAFGFIGLQIRQTVAKSSEKVANYIMNGQDRDALFKGMDKDEYVKGGFGAEVSAGFGASSGNKVVGSSAKYRESTASKYTSNGGSSSFKESSVHTKEYSLSGIHTARPSVGLAGKLQFQSEGRNKDVQGEVSGEVKMSAAQLNAVLVSTTWFSGLVTVFGQLVTKGANMFKGEGAQQVGQFVGMINTVNLGNVVGGHFTDAALKRLTEFSGVNIGHKVTIKAHNKSNKFGGEITLERFSDIEVGKNERAPVYLLIQNIDPVISIKF